MNVTRVTVSVPKELRNRMKTLNSKANWSAIACDAFDTFIREHKKNPKVSKKLNPSAYAIVERLRFHGLIK